MSNPSTDKRKTVLKAFRISESLARSLEREAADEGISVSADLNSIISDHFDWHKKAQEFGIIEVPKSVFMSLTDGLDDEALARIGREVVPAAWKEMAEFWFQDSSPNGILTHLLTRSKFNSYNRTRVTQDEGNYSIVLHHDFGPKWSTIAKNALQEFVKQSFHVEPRITVGESVVTARFKVKPRSDAESQHP